MGKRTESAKISDIEVGRCGIDGCAIGIVVTFKCEHTYITYDKCAWDHNHIKPTEHSEWGEETRMRNYAEIMIYISDILNKAKADTLDQLIGRKVVLKFDSDNYYNLKNFIGWEFEEES